MLKREGKKVAVIFAIISIFLIIWNSQTILAQYYDIYISNNGDDLNNGAVNSPIKSLDKAKDIIRNLQRPLTEPVNVYLRQGTYILDETFKLDDLEKDSGSSSFPINYQSYPGEKATITSGIKLNLNWQQYNSNVYYADISSHVARYGYFNSLFIGGERATRARIPDKGNYPITKFDKENNSAFYFNPGEINSSWRNLGNIEIVASGNWIQSRFNIKRIEGNKAYLSGKSNPYYFSWGQDRYYIENVFEGLSEGEWYLDKNEKKLYYWPKMGEIIQNSEFIAPTLKTLIEAGNYSKLKEKSDIDYLEIKDLDSVDKDLSFNGDFTISMFVKVPETAKTEGEWILSKGDVWNSKGLGVYIELNSTFLIMNDGSKKTSPSKASTFYSRDYPAPEYASNVGEWMHVAWTVNRKSGVIKSYGNGVYRSGLDMNISNLREITDIASSLIIGRLNTVGFTGSIDELKIYNRVLTNDEIKKLFNNQQISNNKPEVSLSFENNLKDNGNGNVPLVYGNPLFTEGKYGKAISFLKKNISNENNYDYCLNNVNFNNLMFSYTDWELTTNGYPGSQSDYYLDKPAVVLITKDSNFEYNTISHTGEYALASYSKNLKIENNNINDLGAGAIRAGQIGEYWNYKLLDKITNSHIIRNNLITNTGKVFRASPAITIYHSGNNEISNNEIYNSSFSGISLNWFTVSDWDTFVKGNSIRYNKISNVMRDLNDGGGIYLIGKQPGTLVENNIIKDVKKTEEHLSNQFLFGLYFDNAEDIIARNNLIKNAEYSGIIFYKKPDNPRSYNKNNTVTNNLFIDSSVYQTFFNSRDDNFTKNIIYYNDLPDTEKTQLIYSNDAGIIKYSDNNLFYTPKTVPVYRFWNNNAGTHFYTISEAEKQSLIANYSYVWTLEGIAFYVYEDKIKGTLPVYRFYNKNTGTHFYTISEAEKQSLIANYSYVWTYEGVGFYVYSNLKEYPLKNMLDSWRLLGYDKNSINENPMFVDYWNENFELKENSPALKNPINFKNINFSLVGINNKSINPISYWKFDGNANDAVGTNNGIINGAVLTSGVSGQAYRFDGVNDYISTLEKDKLDSLQKGTITAWIKCNTICPVGAIVSYASKSQASSNFLLRVNNNVLEYAWNPGGSTSWNTINSPTKINDNKWHHVAFVSDGLTRNRIYLDGIKQTTTFSKPSGRGYENDWIADINAISSSGHHISIGVLDRGSPTNWFKGDIDEIKIWDKVLTDSEIKQEYESKASTLSTYALVNKENKNLFLDWLKNLF